MDDRQNVSYVSRSKNSHSRVNLKLKSKTHICRGDLRCCVDPSVSCLAARLTDLRQHLHGLCVVLLVTNHAETNATGDVAVSIPGDVRVCNGSCQHFRVCDGSCQHFRVCDGSCQYLDSKLPILCCAVSVEVACGRAPYLLRLTLLGKELRIPVGVPKESNTMGYIQDRHP